MCDATTTQPEPFLSHMQARIEQEQTQAAGLREAASTLEQAAHDAQVRVGGHPY
jgi:hypothetical protein